MNKINNLPTLVIPKGRLYNGIKNMFQAKGIILPNEDSRTYFFPNYFEDCNLFIAKPKAIPQLINSGICEFGFCGHDIIADSDYSNNFFIADKINLLYQTDLNKVNIVIASSNKKLEPTIDKSLIVATEFPLLASKLFTLKGIPHYILATSGSTEGYTSIGADCIMDVCESGDTIKANGLYINEIVMQSSTCLFGHISLCDCLLPSCLTKIIGDGNSRN